MSSSRSIVTSLLSLACLAIFLYYTITPQGPRLLWVLESVADVKMSSDMKIRAEKFTPEVMIQMPKRSYANPNSAGSHAVYTVSAYSLESHRKTNEIKVLDLSTGQSNLVTNQEKTKEPNWLGDENELLWLQSVDRGATRVIIGSADGTGKTYIAGTVPGPISDVKLKTLDRNRVAIAFAAKARPDGSLFNQEDEPKKYMSGRLYDNSMVRHWDHYVTPNRNTIWHGILHKAKPHITESKGRYSLGTLTNVLRGTHLKSPIPPFGGLDHFDLTFNGIAFIAKDPDLNSAFNTKGNFYYIAMNNSANEIHYSHPIKVEIEGFEGASTSPAFSPDGKGAVFLQMKENGYEADKNRIILIPTLEEPGAALELLKTNDGKGSWDRSPGSIIWANDGQAFILVAEDEGVKKLFKMNVPYGGGEGDFPTELTRSGAISDVQALREDSTYLFISSTSLIDNSIYSLLDLKATAGAKVISSHSRNGSSLGLAQEQVSSIWFQGASRKVHAWVIKPSNFSSGTTYPMAFIIHGGPQGSWTDSWSLRWNLALYAEQGYVVVAPNPTGSTGYGQAFVDAISGSWGGLPFEDLVKGFEYVKKNLDYVDTNRSVALGASYGAYMMAWMQGHPIGKEFKAFVCHDGSFNVPSQLASDEQYFPNHELGGPYYENPEGWEKWSPSRSAANWSTPMLVVHSELDYRLQISEGLTMFNLLQEKRIESRFLTFPDEGHWVLKEDNSYMWHVIVINWINKFVGLPEYKNEKDLGIEVQN